MIYGSNLNNKSQTNPQNRNGSSFKHAGVGAVDPFNKKKLAEEAKRDQEKIKADQREVERRKIQLQIDNLQRELIRLTADLQLKQNHFTESKRKTDSARREFFLLEGKIKKEEGEISYLGHDSATQDRRVNNTEAELEKAQAQIDLAEREKAVLEKNYNQDRFNLSDVETKISRLQAELVKLTAEENVLHKEITQDEVDINSKKAERDRLVQGSKNLEINTKQAVGDKSGVFKNIQNKEKEIKEERQDLFLKKRIAEQLESELTPLSQEIARLNREKADKEREIADLKRKKDVV